MESTTGRLDFNGGLHINNGVVSAGVSVLHYGGAVSTGRGVWRVDGGTLRVYDGSEIQQSGFVHVAEGLLNVASSSGVTTEYFRIDELGTIDIAGQVTVSDQLAVKSQSGWTWRGSSSLLINGGTDADLSSWAAIEIGGADLGIDPGNHIGASAGFTNSNFYIPTLIIGEESNAFLVDAFQNAGDGVTPEALYVGNLIFEDSLGSLNLNGLNLYFNNLTGSLAQIIDNVVPGDFDGDGDFDCTDVDSLVLEIVAGSNNASFDVNGDGAVDPSDLEAWLRVGGISEIGASFLPADSNLDGFVDGQDFNIWNQNKFTQTSSFCSGDFNADGFVDGSDFNVWNQTKFSSSIPLSVVPEPRAMPYFMFISALIVIRRRAFA